MYTIEKQFEFSAAHQLDGLPESHPCSRLHGHNYSVVVVLQSDKLDEHGFVVDFGELRKLRQYIDENLDHHYLNDVLQFQPTAENIARHLFFLCLGWWPETVAVKVSETSKTWATYWPGLYRTHVRLDKDGVHLVAGGKSVLLEPEGAGEADPGDGKTGAVLYAFI